MPKKGNLFARFFSGLALPSPRFQASRIRGKGPDSTGILRDTLAPPPALMHPRPPLTLFFAVRNRD